MNRIRIALASLLLLGFTVVCYAQSTGQSQTSGQQSGTLNQEEQKHPAAVPPPQPPETQQPEAAPQRNPEEKPPAQKEEKPGKAEEPKPQEQPKAGHEEHGTTSEHAHARPAGKSAHIPEAKFKANFGRQHTVKVQQVITTTTIVPNQTQFVYGGYTFVFLDPWPAGWLLTDDCYIDFIGDEYVLVDVLHPGVTVALFVVG